MKTNNTTTPNTSTTLSTKPNESELADIIARYLVSKKAEDVIVLNLANKTTIADYFVIASSRNSVHSKALAEGVDEILSKEYKIEPLRRDGIAGTTDVRWVVLDYSAVIVHIFNKETRELYRLEQLWTGNKDNIVEYK